jgi:hypothetical protein
MHSIQRREQIMRWGSMAHIVIAGLLLNALPARADFIDIHLEFVSGPLDDTFSLMRLDVAALPPVGGGDVFNVQDGTLIDLDTTVSGASFDETDDVDFDQDQFFPFFGITRLTNVDGEVSGRIDSALERITGERLAILIVGPAVGGPIDEDQDYFCYFVDAPPIGIGGGAASGEASSCIVSAIEMAITIDDLTGLPRPAASLEAAALAERNRLRVGDADLRAFVAAEPGPLALLSLGLIGLALARRRRRAA